MWDTAISAPAHADLMLIPSAGDILIVATDGVFDNLFQEQILELLQKSKEVFV